MSKGESQMAVNGYRMQVLRGADGGGAIDDHNAGSRLPRWGGWTFSCALGVLEQVFVGRAAAQPAAQATRC
jgi:hypothetical protein